METGHSTSLTTNSSICVTHITLVGRSILAGALTVQAYISHSFPQLLQGDVTFNTAFPLHITILICQQNVHKLHNWYSTLNKIIQTVVSFLCLPIHPQVTAPKLQRNLDESLYERLTQNSINYVFILILSDSHPIEVQITSSVTTALTHKQTSNSSITIFNHRS